MIDKIFASNGVGFCYIMTASGNHLQYESIRKRKGCPDIMENLPERKPKQRTNKGKDINSCKYRYATDVSATI